eukprot:TRINITY_DN34808_c0_g1_i1.p1 TRINITY_DN34808_c0_g1~~TRINITY_DN34808_c0_g1_i1.p1  ORF type:complete len:537 (-),score=89.69 TRINITY_DN34808_c0_g1_i1:369-1979(-)
MMSPLQASVQQPMSLAGNIEEVPLDTDDDDDSCSDEGQGLPTPQASAQLLGKSPDGHPPPRIMASRGLTGLIEETLGEQQQENRFTWNSVFLNVYDVSESQLIQKINRIFTADDRLLAGGVFHAGVELFGKEWCYGATVPGRSGVGAVMPRMHPQHRYRATVYMGSTDKSPEQISALLARMAGEWPGSEYHLIHHNCLSFCNVLLEKLGLRKIPGWVDRAARAASQVDNAVQAVKGISAEKVQGQAAEALDQIRRDSLTALAHAADESHKLIEIAKEQAQVEAQELGATANELASLAQEQLSSIGTSIWQWGQNIQEKVESTSGPTLSELSVQAEEQVQTLGESLWSWGQTISKDLKETLEGPKHHKDRSRKSKRSGKLKRFPIDETQSPAGDRGYPAAFQEGQMHTSQPFVQDLLGDFSTDGDNMAVPTNHSRADPRGTAGLIRAQETRLLTQSLLDDQDEDDEPQQQTPIVWTTVNAPNVKPCLNLPPPAELPTQAQVPAPGSPSPKKDLLDDWEPQATCAPVKPLESSIDLLS